MIKLVALDLDGTIVNHDLKISDRVMRLLQHLIQNTDVRVVIATGRMYLSALPFAHSIGVKEPVVCYQGAMVRDIDTHRTVLHHRPISMPVAREVLELLLLDKFGVNVYIDDNLYTSHSDETATYYARLAGVTPVMSPNLLEHLTAEPTKMMVIDDYRLDQVITMLGEKYHQRLNYCRSRTNFCEIIDVSASKWNAVNALAEKWGILPEEIMAVGDQENDLSMIEHAGVGVAMGNAPDHVKAMANYITSPIDTDGAAEAIEKFVLGHLPLKDDLLEGRPMGGRNG